jgi:hypothetical protein
MKDIGAKSLLVMSIPFSVIGSIFLLGSGICGSKKIMEFCNKTKLWILTKKKKSYFWNSIHKYVLNMYDLGNLVKSGERKFLYNSRHKNIGDPFVLLNGIWVCKYNDVKNILNDITYQKPKAVGTIDVCIPELFHPKVLIFNNNNEYKNIKEYIIKNIFSKTLFQNNNEILKKWGNDNPEERYSVSKIVTKIIFKNIFNIDLDDKQSELGATYEKDRLFVLFPNFYHKLLFNIKKKKLIKLRKDVYNIINRNIESDNSPINKEDLSYVLTDMVLFAGVVGTTHLTYAVLHKIKENNDMLQLYKSNPYNFIVEAARLDPPVTSLNVLMKEDKTYNIYGKDYNFKKGTHLMAVISEANIDPEVFEEPEKFNPNRDLTKVLSWNGFGFRKCPARDISINICKTIIDYYIENLYPIKYKINVSTGIFDYSGTDSKVTLTINGSKSQIKTDLDNKFENNFEEGNIDTFEIFDRPVGKIKSIKVELNNFSSYKFVSIPFEEWYLNKINIECKNKLYHFPLYKWINNKESYTIVNNNLLLPQNDLDNNDVRRNDIISRRVRYQHSHNHKILRDTSALPSHCRNVPKNEKVLDTDIDLNKVVIDVVGNLTYAGLFSGEIRTLDDYRKIFDGKYLPNIIPDDEDLRLPENHLMNWDSDEEFGRQRLCGLNPLVIERIKKIPEDFYVTNEIVRDFLENSLEEELNNNKIYLCDYKLLIGLEGATIDYTKRYVYAPYCLLYQNSENNLVPIAIQIYREKNSVIFTPKDNYYEWLAAKIYCSNSDFHVHQFEKHALWCHLIFEPVSIALNRNFSTCHPLYNFIKIHFHGLININDMARGSLVAPDNEKAKAMFGSIMSTGSDGNIKILLKAYEIFSFENLDFIKNLENRNMLNTGLNYHYEEDGLLIYNCIKEYVNDFMNYFYKNENDFKEDFELKNFIHEIENEVKLDFKIDTIGSFKKFLVITIFTESALHAALNYSQIDYGAMIINCPGMIRKKAPKEKGIIKDTQFIMDMMPNKKWACIQVGILTFLSQRTKDKLGYYIHNMFGNHKSYKIIKKFQNSLNKIEDLINNRNKKRQYPYKYLLPSNIPNSTSI